MQEAEKQPQRIHILGASGSGKTTLARLVAERLDCSWHELDTIAYEGGFARKRTLEERLASLQEITSQPVWVTEGFFLWWIDDLLDAADTIIWLDLPWYVSISRVVTRHFKLSWKGENRHPGIHRLAKFLWGCRLYYLESDARAPKEFDDDEAVNRAGAKQNLAPYMEKVVQCLTPADVDKFLAHLNPPS